MAVDLTVREKRDPSYDGAFRAVMRRITMFRLPTDHIYDGDPIRI
jgi:hypothetical protein